MAEEKLSATVKITNIPKTAVAVDLLRFLETHVGESSVYAVDISTEHRNWKSRGNGRVQFETLDSKSTALSLSQTGRLNFRGQNLVLSHSPDDVIARPVRPENRVHGGSLSVGLLGRSDRMLALECWDEGVKVFIMPEKKCVEFWVSAGGVCYRMVSQFSDFLEAWRSCVGGQVPNAVLFQLKHAPKIYQKFSGRDVSSRFSPDRYHICKEDCNFIWVRTIDFSNVKSIGQSSAFCLTVGEGSPSLDVFTSLPFYREDLIELTIEDGEEFHSSSDVVPLVRCPPESKLPYEILYQLNSLVHTQKLSLPAVDSDLIDVLTSVDLDSALAVLLKMHKLASTCYDPISFIKTRIQMLRKNDKNLPSSCNIRLEKKNVMSCHRILITPTKIYCTGPELESSNYIVKHFAANASDFVRVTFVEEDWSKLPPNAFSTSLQQGIFSKPQKTKIYQRVLDVLREGIVIGVKRFQFLAFSASQLRSNSVWMFASSEHLRAEDIREWMGSFKSIRSVSKCAARMGQLFSASKQTMEVPSQQMEVIPDIEVTTDGVDYCFSDGIGKISVNFAWQVAQKCGLDHTPSAFQIRYGGYKGVIAVDHNCFCRLSLRNSMHKFESKNRMLNITSWTDYGPCYLNREVVTLLSTLGVEDSAFEALQDVQLRLLDSMLTSREAALDILDSMGSGDIKSIIVKLLLQGYEPNVEPYLSMMLHSHHDLLLSDLRKRCRIFVPKGRIMIGCLDETGILNYGQVYVRVTMTKAEQQGGRQSFFRNVDEATSVVTGKVVVTKNPCLHPGDVRVLEAVYDVALEEKGMIDCVVFPQNGERPHTNECSGGDLDGDLYFISWDETIIPPKTVTPMDNTERNKRIMDHDVSLEEIQRFFVDYMINDTLGAISTAHLVHADREPDKALSSKCLQLAALHSMAVDFAKNGAPAEMPRFLTPREYPDFMERWDKPMYTSQNALGKLYRATKTSMLNQNSNFFWSEEVVRKAYDSDLEVEGFETCLPLAQTHKELYWERMSSLLKYYEAETEDEILTGNLRNKSSYLQRDNRRYGETKDRILVAIKSLHREAKGWFESSCEAVEQQKLASAWYHVTYHPDYCQESMQCLGFPWIVGDILLGIKSLNKRKMLM